MNYFALVEGGIKAGTVSKVIASSFEQLPDVAGYWVETFADARNGPMAGVGYTYDQERGRFIPPRPYPSWVLSESGYWQAPIPTPQEAALWDEHIQAWITPLQDCINKAKESVDQFANRVRVRVAGTSDTIQIASWNNKLRIAKAAIENVATPDETESFHLEISLRGKGESLDGFCEKVIANANQYALATATIDGLQKQAYIAIEAAPSIELVDAVVEQMRSKADEALAQLLRVTAWVPS